MINIIVKLPADVKDVDKALDMCGGLDVIAKQVNQIHNKLTSQSILNQIEMRDVKHKLGFQLTPDCQIPLQTKISQQVICKVVKQTKNGKTRTRVVSVLPCSYEFQCEALADFAYNLDPNLSNKQVLEDKLLASVGTNAGFEVTQVMPSQFTYGKMMYS
jgi:hypothetical protein